MIVRPFGHGAFIAGLLFPALTWAAVTATSFEAQQANMARTWSASPAMCDIPVPDAALTTSAEVSAVKSGLRTYQACLKMAVAKVQSRTSAAAEVKSDFWAELDDTQRQSLQLTLEASNRQAIRTIVKQGSDVAVAANEAFNAYDAIKLAEEVSSDIALIRACGPRFQRLLDRRAELDRQGEVVDSIAQRLRTLGLSIDLGNGMIAAGMGNPGQVNIQVAEFNRQTEQRNRLVNLYNQRNDQYKSDYASYKSDCVGMSVSRKAINEACQGGDTAAYCRGFNN